MAVFLTGRDLTPAYAMTPYENIPGGWTHFSLLCPLNTVPGPTPTSWNLCSFSHPPLCPGPRHSRSYLPASVSPLPWFHNQLQVGDSLNHEGQGYPLQHSGLVAKSRTRLRNFKKKKIMTWLIKKKIHTPLPDSEWLAKAARSLCQGHAAFPLSFTTCNGIEPTTLVSLAPSSP